MLGGNVFDMVEREEGLNSNLSRRPENANSNNFENDGETFIWTEELLIQVLVPIPTVFKQRPIPVLRLIELRTRNPTNLLKLIANKHLGKLIAKSISF